MPMFRGIVEKYLGSAGEYWVNRYMIDAADLASALVTLGTIYAVERNFHLDQVAFTKLRVDDNTPDTNAFITQPLNTLGLRASGASEYMVLFATVRVDFGAGVGSPSRKYYRGCLMESDVSGMNLTSGAITFFNTNAATPLAAVSGFVDVDGEDIANGSTMTRIGMRQLRRGTKKKTTP